MRLLCVIREGALGAYWKEDLLEEGGTDWRGFFEEFYLERRLIQLIGEGLIRKTTY